jgi:beta-glucanase (GH16 family)
LASGVFSDDFHVFAVTWTPESIQWSLDGVQYYSVTPNMLSAGQSWNFDDSFFLLLNVAVGGDWPGSPDATATFPQSMTVDYVRVYKLVE